MSTALTFPLITVEEFFDLPEPAGEFTYELHFGEIVQVGRPKKRHYTLQLRIQRLLQELLDENKWVAGVEMPYGLTPGYDARAADIGVVSLEQFNAIPEEGYLIGSPDLVIQVKSRSNRDRKMEEDAVAHITHGAQCVLLLKPERGEIVAITASSRRVYGRGESLVIESPFSLAISVDDFLGAPTVREDPA